jgi:hypothetical protein
LFRPRRQWLRHESRRLPLLHAISEDHGASSTIQEAFLLALDATGIPLRTRMHPSRDVSVDDGAVSQRDTGPMRFHSVLFRVPDDAEPETPETPVFFSDES